MEETFSHFVVIKCLLILHSLTLTLQVLFQEMPGLSIKEQIVLNLKTERLKKGLVTVEKDISSLQRKLDNINGQRGKLYSYILELKK